jgi:hypothetical protein
MSFIVNLESLVSLENRELRDLATGPTVPLPSRYGHLPNPRVTWQILYQWCLANWRGICVAVAGCGDGTGYHAVHPASTGTTAPVMKDDSELMRNTITSASSSGRA